MTNQARLCNDNAGLNNIAAYLYISCLFALSAIQLNHFKNNAVSLLGIKTSKRKK